MFKKLCLALLSVFVFSTPALAADDTIIVASDPTWPPMEMLDANKEVVGFSTDYIMAVAKEAGLKAEVRNIAWDGIFAALGSRQADVIAASVTITEKRKKGMAFTEPYYEIHQAVVVPIGSPIATMSDLDGKKVGGQIGTSGLVETLPKAKSKAVIKSYDEVGLAMEAMLHGNLDAVICDNAVAKYYANKKQEYAGKFKLAFVPEAAEYYGFALRLEDKDLLAKLNTGIKAVKAKGIDKEISRKWMGE